jgi:hypothetical protein
VIDRIMKGRFVAGLLYYLYGPGKSDEHENPHLVTGWRDPIQSLEPPVKQNGKRDFRRLTGLLDAPLQAIDRCGKPGTVWHCVLSADPGDRLLSDAEWNAIATEFMHQMGLARREDPYGIRWVAVRHGLSKGGIDHVHIAATLARLDGTLPDIHNDFLRARKACQVIEQQYGLAATASADRTAAVRPTRAETEQAQRQSKNEPPRITLRRLVQEAAATAGSEQDFFTRLRNAGALIRERASTTDPGQITGYAVALPGHRAKLAEPVWFGGGKLAPDLTLPRLRRRWDRSRNTEPRGTENLSQRSARALLREAAASAAQHARDDATFFGDLEQAGVLIRYRYSDRDPAQVTGYAVALPGHTDPNGDPIWYSGGRLAAGLTLPALHRQWTDDGAPIRSRHDPAERHALWADIIRLTTASAGQLKASPQAAADAAEATADALRIAARVVRGAAGQDLRRAADDFDRAAREAYGAVPPSSPTGQALRTAVRLLGVLGSAGRGDLGTLIENLAGLAAAAAELRRFQHRAHQAAAARTAADRLCRLADRTRQPAHIPVPGRHKNAAATAYRDHADHPRQPAETQPAAPGRDRRDPRSSRPHGPAP